MFETETGRWQDAQEQMPQDEDENLEELLEEQELDNALHEEIMRARLTGHCPEFMGRILR